MRLTCPNCDAQYEVDEAVIPDNGRDVQCSSCGHTWFQASAAELRAAASTQADAAAPLADDEGGDDEPVQMTHGAAPAAAPEPAGGPATIPEAPAPGDLRRRTLDEAVLSVLREEAERETKARVAEGSAIETQGDLGLVPPPPPLPHDVSPTRSTENHDSETRDDDEPTAALVSRAARRELLPDIEEINSTLRATSERGNEPASMDAPETLRQRRNGFRRGFVSALTVMVLLLLPYILADRIVSHFPAAGPALVRYSQGIDSIRIWMDAQMRSSTQSMRDSTTQTN